MSGELRRVRVHPQQAPSRIDNALVTMQALRRMAGCFETFRYPVSRGFCEGAAAVSANLRFRISIKLRMYIIELGR
jgi:hypothetical protein